MPKSSVVSSGDKTSPLPLARLPPPPRLSSKRRSAHWVLPSSVAPISFRSPSSRLPPRTPALVLENRLVEDLLPHSRLVLVLLDLLDAVLPLLSRSLDPPLVLAALHLPLHSPASPVLHPPVSPVVVALLLPVSPFSLLPLASPVRPASPLRSLLRALVAPLASTRPLADKEVDRSTLRLIYRSNPMVYYVRDMLELPCIKRAWMKANEALPWFKRCEFLCWRLGVQ
ncbi:hypothetical protein SMACR_05965 [Sordaria macrospora]|uniref:Uncharacterized protein n=1 Tax=Sordaria macrospora TaxID=5147 RepID=A0A8S8ZVW9_SORMA|nr:hypothetical protein SMACR_05965 [Sordaria macrospora]